MNALVKARNFEEFVDILKETAYGFLFEGQNQISFEHSYSEFIYRVYRKRFRSEAFTIASVIAYIRMKEMELSNIISIIEGIRYKLPEENIRRFVVGMNF
jgi:V/A-type H+-transporting ATPase subunit C